MHTHTHTYTSTHTLLRHQKVKSRWHESVGFIDVDLFSNLLL